MYIKVKVKAGAKDESLIKKGNDHFDISVKEKAERNLANSRVLELIGSYFKLPKGKVRIINGHHSPGKILSVDIE